MLFLDSRSLTSPPGGVCLFTWQLGPTQYPTSVNKKGFLYLSESPLNCATRGSLQHRKAEKLDCHFPRPAIFTIDAQDPQRSRLAQVVSESTRHSRCNQERPRIGCWSTRHRLQDTPNWQTASTFRGRQRVFQR